MRRASDRRTLISLSKAVVAAGALLALLAVACGDDGETTSMEQQTPQAETAAPTAAPKPKSYDSPPPMTIDPNKQYTATIVLEKGGEIVIELFAKETPMTVNNFVFLARDGYYDGVTFHRVLPGFMAQTGDPTGTGSGGPGYRFEDEFHPDRRHDDPGVLSMANAGENTNGSQFFITFTRDAPTGLRAFGVRPGDQRHGGGRGDHSQASRRGHDAWGRHEDHQDLRRSSAIP